MKQNINNSILENITTRLQRSKINKETIMHKKESGFFLAKIDYNTVTSKRDQG